MIRHIFLCTMALFLLAGCGGGGDTASDTPNAAETTLTILPHNDTVIHTGTTVAFELYEAAAGRIDENITWELSDATFGTVDAKGRFHAKKGGDVTITARYKNDDADYRLVVNDANITHLQAYSGEYLIHQGGSSRLFASAFYDDGTTQDVTADTDWNILCAGQATIENPQTPHPRIRAIAAGGACIEAAFSTARSYMLITVKKADLQRIDIQSSTTTLHSGTAAKLNAYAYYSDGLSTDISEDITWYSSNENALSIDNSAEGRGTVHAYNAGASIITASFGDLNQSERFESIEAELSTLALSGAYGEIHLFELEPGTYLPHRLNLMASGTFDSGLTQQLNGSVQWQSSDETVASITAEGMLNVIYPGKFTITATYKTHQATLLLNAVATPLETLFLSSYSPTLAAGLKVQLKAYGRDLFGKEFDITNSVFWLSGNRAIASVSNMENTQGEVLAQMSGPVKISALYANKSAAINFNIDEAAVTAIRFEHNETTMPKGSSMQLQLIGILSDGSERNITTSALWSSDNPYILSVGNEPPFEGLLSALNAGEADINVSYGALQSGMHFTVTDPELTALHIIAPQTAIKRGQEMRLKAIGTFSDGTQRDLSDIVTWSSSYSDTATVAQGGYFYAANIGDVYITASYKGLSGSIWIEVTEPAIRSILIQPSALEVDVNKSITLTAIGIYEDSRRDVITNKVTWSSLYPTIASVNASGVVTGLKDGSAEIAAYYRGFEATQKLKVNRVIDHVKIISPATSVNVPDTLQLTLSAVYNDGSSETVSETIIWGSYNSYIAGVDDSGLLSAEHNGTVTISALYANQYAASLQIDVHRLLDQIRIDAAKTTLAIGETLQLSLTALYNDSSFETVQNSIVWGTYDSYIATIDNNGLISGEHNGTVTISAVYDGKSDTEIFTIQ